jgi:hypothetical protein
MLTLSSEKSLARFISIGAFLTTVVVIWGSVTDPVNTPKLFILGSAAFAAGAIAFAMGVKELWRSSRLWLIGSFVFIVFSISAIVNSASPIEQNIYGTYGRNTGFVTYLALLLISTAATLLRQKSNFNLILMLCLRLVSPTLLTAFGRLPLGISLDGITHTETS